MKESRIGVVVMSMMVVIMIRCVAGAGEAAANGPPSPAYYNCVNECAKNCHEPKTFCLAICVIKCQGQTGGASPSAASGHHLRGGGEA